tara:strand:+ start:744 stop:905 length:162 start_codon:yes stop_codon:yes gene_type:complete
MRIKIDAEGLQPGEKLVVQYESEWVLIDETDDSPPGEEQPETQPLVLTKVVSQ